MSERTLLPQFADSNKGQRMRYVCGNYYRTKSTFVITVREQATRNIICYCLRKLIKETEYQVSGFPLRNPMKGNNILYQRKKNQ